MSQDSYESSRLRSNKNILQLKWRSTNNFQECPQCGEKIGVLSGSKDAICQNCGYKDPCCE